MLKIKDYIRLNPKVFRLFQVSRGLSVYPERRPRLEGFDHDGLGERFRLSILSKSKYFSEYSSALHDAFNNAGIDTDLCSDIAEDNCSHAILVVGVHSVARSELQRLQKKYVIAGIQTEQICSVNQGSYRYAAYQLKRFKAYSKYVDVLFDWHRENAKILNGIHPSVHYVPHGGLSEKVNNRNDDFEVAFFGNVNAVSGRREKILKELMRRYKVYPKTADIWRDDKDLAFNSSKIIINLHAEASLVFESPRFYEATSYGRLVVSEPIFDSHPFKSGIHFAEGQLSEITETLDFYLGNCEERHQLEDAAQKLSQEYSIQKLAKTMRDAIVLRHYLLTT